LNIELANLKTRLATRYGNKLGPLFDPADEIEKSDEVVDYMIAGIEYGESSGRKSHSSGSFLQENKRYSSSIILPCSLVPHETDTLRKAPYQRITFN
jgi:hypothetical protein